MSYALSLTILNLTIVSKINIQWSCLPAFSYPPFETIKVGNTFEGETKTLMPRWSDLNVLILSNSKNTWFCVCGNKSYIVATIIKKHANIFC